MVILQNYQAFVGRHWETGSVANAFAYSGVCLPGLDRPYSEALLLGISGGIVMGYFSFAYQGYDPHVALLTRNTFDPLETLLSRLGVEQETLQTLDPTKGLANLIRVLEHGDPALTWVDVYSLPYWEADDENDMYWMYPVVVYGVDAEQDRAWIADRSAVPLSVPLETLAVTRGRVKKEKYRVTALSRPNPQRLLPAIRQGIEQTIRLYTADPPKGSRENFGLAAYRRWSELLEKPGMSKSWARVFPPGRAMMAGLITAYQGTEQNGPGADAERGMYADFLEEASALLEQPGLAQAAAQFRLAGQAWEELGRALLPAEYPLLGEARALLHRRKMLFREQGQAAQADIAAINQRLRAIKQQAVDDFPIGKNALPDFFAHLRERIWTVHDLEQSAVRTLQAVLPG